MKEAVYVSYYDILKKTSAPDKEAARVNTINKICKRFSKELKVTDPTISKLTEIYKKITLTSYCEAPAFIHALINQTYAIITDHRMNSTFINNMFALYQTPEKYPDADKEQYSMSHLHNSDLRTCTQFFTLYMRAKGNYLYFLNTGYDFPNSIRFNLDNIKDYFRKNNDTQNRKLFSELFTLVKQYIEKICGEDWYTMYLHFLYKHSNEEKYYYILHSFPHMQQIKNNMTS